MNITDLTIRILERSAAIPGSIAWYKSSVTALSPELKAVEIVELLNMEAVFILDFNDGLPLMERLKIKKAVKNWLDCNGSIVIRHYVRFRNQYDQCDESEDGNERRVF